MRVLSSHRFARVPFLGAIQLVGASAVLLLALAAHADEKPQPAATPAGTPPPTSTAKQEALDSIDSRIQNLQSTRDCIDKASTNHGVDSCRAGLKRSPKKSSKGDVKK